MVLSLALAAAVLAGCGSAGTSSSGGEGSTGAEQEFVYLEEVLGTEQYGIGFRKEDTELCELVNAGLDALAADGTFDEIGKKYPEIYDYLTLNKEAQAEGSTEAAEAPEVEGKYGKGFVFKHGFDKDYDKVLMSDSSSLLNSFRMKMGNCPIFLSYLYTVCPYCIDHGLADINDGDIICT